MADIYKLHYDLYKQDKDFWWKLVMEEEAHAALLRSGKEHFLPANSFPEKILSSSFTKLMISNKLADEYIHRLKQQAPPREVAFSTAYHFENMVGELNFQSFMIKQADTKLEKIFQKLNQDSKDHARRILDYMIANGIKVLETEALLSI